MTWNTIISLGYEVYFEETGETLKKFTDSIGEAWRFAKQKATEGSDNAENIVIGRCSKEAYLDNDGTLYYVSHYTSIEPIAFMNCVAVQNDVFRKRLHIPQFGTPQIQGRFVLSKGIQSLTPQVQIEVFAKIRNYNDFTVENSPSEERSFGVIYHADVSVVWTIDSFDENYQCSGEGRANPKVSRRVLKIVLEREYLS